jgi:L-ectoine synthase
MKIIHFDDLRKTEREVHCPKGDFVSFRYLLKKDKMGFTLTKTFIKKNDNCNFWHYKKHLEACYCIEGGGYIIEQKNNKKHLIAPGTVYALDKHDAHKFIAKSDTVLLCVFNPPLIGKEVHKLDGSY